MEKYIKDERTGLKYELVGDYYLPVGSDEPEPEPLGIWGQRRHNYLRDHRRVAYTSLFLTGKLEAHLRETDRQAEELFLRLVHDLAVQEGITEHLKATDQMAWVSAMNNIRQRAAEIVNVELIFGA